VEIMGVNFKMAASLITLTNTIKATLTIIITIGIIIIQETIITGIISTAFNLTLEFFINLT